MAQAARGHCGVDLGPKSLFEPAPTLLLLGEPPGGAGWACRKQPAPRYLLVPSEARGSRHRAGQGPSCPPLPRGRLSPSCPYGSPATKRCEGHLQTSLGCTPLPGALSLRSSPSPAGLPQACSQASSAEAAGRTPLNHRSVSPDGSSLPSGPTSSCSRGPARGSMPSRHISHQPCHAAPLRSQTTSPGTPSLSSSPRPPSSSRLRFPPPAPSVLYHWVSALLVLTVSTFLNPTRAPVHAV